MDGGTEQESTLADVSLCCLDRDCSLLVHASIPSTRPLILSSSELAEVVPIGPNFGGVIGPLASRMSQFHELENPSYGQLGLFLVGYNAQLLPTTHEQAFYGLQM